ncbi:MAG: DUF4126 domain-containing protein [Steroidobacteraceae bacterium]
MSLPETLLAAALGVSLAAAVGFRVFVPLLVVAVAAKSGWMDLPASFDWLGSAAAIAMLAVAAVAEIAAYYIPGVDNLLDAIAAPLAVIAGTMLVAAPLWELPPLLKWTTAVIAGGGAAGVTQGLTSLLRAKSTLATGGLANPVVSTGELGGSLLLSILALLMPLVALLFVAIALVLVFRRIRRLARRTV